MTTEELNKAQEATPPSPPTPSPLSEAAKTEPRDDGSLTDPAVWLDERLINHPVVEALQQRIAALEADVAFLRTYHAWPTKS